MHSVIRSLRGACVGHQYTCLQLEALVAIADMGSFEAAGRKLGSVQSGVSRHVRELKAYFPRQLFERGLRSARLTAAALELLSQARTILRQRDVLLSQYASEKILRR